MKRLFDLVTIFLFIPFIIIICAIIALLIKFKLGSPILFKQQRPGLNGKVFKLIKFRTMSNDRDSDGNLLPDIDRLTEFGKFLRSTSLDELPEFWNVLEGNMSLVGPRPLLLEYMPLYNIKQKRRHKVLPGITGWAQVNGRNGITWDKKFSLDLWYIDNQTIWLDVKILLITIKKILLRDSINQNKTITMEKFKANH